MNTFFIVFMLMFAIGIVALLGPPRIFGGYSQKRAVQNAAESYSRVLSKAEAKKAGRKSLLLLFFLVATLTLIAALLDGLI